MRVTIKNKPLNHTLWFFIYLLCFLFGICIQGKCENTQTVNRTIHMWRLINGKAQGEETPQEQRPKHRQPPLDTPALLPYSREASRPQRKQYQHPSGFKAQSLPSAVQNALARRGNRSSRRTGIRNHGRTSLRLGSSLQRPNAKRSSTTALAGPSVQEEMHQRTCRCLPDGVTS